MSRIYPIITAIWLLFADPSQAVQLAPNGVGQALIYPYYTVNNNLNTAYSVVNTTDQPKAVKVIFREGDAGLAVLTFNVYLAAHDVWTGVLAPTTSSQAGHEGEPSVLHGSGDGSCAPYLSTSGQPFLPHLIDQDLRPDNTSMNRSRQGFFEVIEMGVLTGVAAEHVSFAGADQPAGCVHLTSSWDDGNWDFAELSQPTGGLEGSAILVDVAQGLSFSYNALALEQFWLGSGQHTEPGAPLPDLSSGSTQSRVLLEDGSLQVSDWDFGYQAVSAVLMRNELINEYALEFGVQGLTEWVISLPTKHHHVRGEPGPPVPPFTERWDGAESCDEVEFQAYDREGFGYYNNPCLGIGTCTRVYPKLCASVNVSSFQVVAFNQPPAPEFSEILGVSDRQIVDVPFGHDVSENGWVSMTVLRHARHMRATTGAFYFGLPMTGFAVQRYTNGGAAEGLLAQYGGLFMHKSRTRIVE